MRGMGEDFSPALLSYKSYSPTRRAGWGLNPGLSTFELVKYVCRNALCGNIFPVGIECVMIQKRFTESKSNHRFPIS